MKHIYSYHLAGESIAQALQDENRYFSTMTTAYLAALETGKKFNCIVMAVGEVKEVAEINLNRIVNL